MALQPFRRWVALEVPWTFHGIPFIWFRGSSNSPQKATYAGRIPRLTFLLLAWICKYTTLYSRFRFLSFYSMCFFFFHSYSSFYFMFLSFNDYGLGFTQISKDVPVSCEIEDGAETTGLQAGVYSYIRYFSYLARLALYWLILDLRVYHVCLVRSWWPHSWYQACLL